MCHFLFKIWGLSNFFDYHFGEALAMAVFAAIAFAALLLEYDNLIALHGERLLRILPLLLQR